MRSLRMPPVTTSVTTSSPTDSTLSSISPSSSRIRSPSLTSPASPSWLQVIQSSVPGSVPDRMRNFAPATNSMLSPTRAPLRTFGPDRSSRMATAFLLNRATRRMFSTWMARSPWLAWEQFSRATSMPAFINRPSISGVEEAGPRVAMIFVLRTACKDTPVGVAPLRDGLESPYGAPQRRPMPNDRRRHRPRGAESHSGKRRSRHPSVLHGRC